MTHLEVKDTYLNNMHVQYNRRILRFIKGIVRAQKTPSIATLPLT